jgi:hypothetical protein
MRAQTSHIYALPGTRELRDWLRSHARPRVTLYLPLAQAAGASARNEQLREQAVRDLDGKLVAIGAASSTWRDRIASLEVDVRRLAPHAATLAVFADAHAVRALPLRAALGYGVYAGDQFALRPLLGVLARSSRYRLLAVSEHRVALFEGGPDGLRPAPHAGLPRSLEDALGGDTTENELRVRGTRAGGGGPVFYSHGSARDQRSLDAERFHVALAHALAHVLKDDGIPLVFAGSDEHRARLAPALPNLVDEGVHGNVDRLGSAELHARAWPVVERWCAARGEACRAQWERARNRGKGLDFFDDVAAAAAFGRVRTLWVDADLRRAGGVDPVSGRTVSGCGDDDALDSLVELVLAHGGDVVPVAAAALPSASGVAAVLH